MIEQNEIENVKKRYRILRTIEQLNENLDKIKKSNFFEFGSYNDVNKTNSIRFTEFFPELLEKVKQLGIENIEKELQNLETEYKNTL